METRLVIEIQRQLAIRSTISSAASAADRRPCCRARPSAQSLPVVADVAAGAGDRLFERVAGEHAEQDRQAVVRRRSRTAPVLTARLMCWSCVVSPRITAPRQITASVAAAGGQAVGHRWESRTRRAPRPRRSASSATPCSAERLHRAVEQPRGDRLVEPRHDDREAALGRSQVASKYRVMADLSRCQTAI